MMLCSTLLHHKTNVIHNNANNARYSSVVIDITQTLPTRHSLFYIHNSYLR